MENQRAKKILEVAVGIYLASFLILNWADVSWIFNYKVVSTLVSDFFNPYPSIEASTINTYFYPNHSPASAKTPDGQANAVRLAYTDKQNTLEIPKIAISVPIIFSDSTDKDSLTKNLESGTVYYPGSVYPGQTGQIVILGHSAPAGWPKIKYDWVFTDLEKLSAGDEIYIDLNNKQYKYVVQKTTIIQRGAEVPHSNLDENSSVLTLISCWPPGKDYQRIAVEALLTDN